MTNVAPKEQKFGHWMDETIIRQLSKERDFKDPAEVKFRYGVLCGHRMGSNLLCEALYETGMAGDPMEYFNKPLLQAFYEEKGKPTVSFDDYFGEMQKRRTSPNGVFGYNIKIDQFRNYFKNLQGSGIQMIKECDLIIFLYRKNKIKQAVSQYIGGMRKTFRVPADADYEEIKKLVDDVPFNPSLISQCLTTCIEQEHGWLNFMKNQNIDYVPLAYEDLVANYDETINMVLGKIGVPESDRNIPKQPTMKITTGKNEELVDAYTNLILGDKDMSELLPNLQS